VKSLSGEVAGLTKQLKMANLELQAADEAISKRERNLIYYDLVAEYDELQSFCNTIQTQFTEERSRWEGSKMMLQMKMDTMEKKAKEMEKLNAALVPEGVSPKDLDEAIANAASLAAVIKTKDEEIRNLKFACNSKQSNQNSSLSKYSDALDQLDKQFKEELETLKEEKQAIEAACAKREAAAMETIQIYLDKSETSQESLKAAKEEHQEYVKGLEKELEIKKIEIANMDQNRYRQENAKLRLQLENIDATQVCSRTGVICSGCCACRSTYQVEARRNARNRTAACSV
jgi:chromosome segregation ATPase